MRELEIGVHRFTKVVARDDPAYGACHIYSVFPADREENVFAHIQFQKGPVQEVGVNGCFMEDLLIIVCDRLQSFQSGGTACEENEHALAATRLALEKLNKRTLDRQSRDVEGTSKL